MKSFGVNIVGRVAYFALGVAVATAVIFGLIL
jgi:hypothetical protein